MSNFNCDYDSNFGDEPAVVERERRVRKRRREEGCLQSSKAKAHSSVFSEEAALDEGRKQRHKLLALNAYDRHKLLVNDYLLHSPGDVEKLLTRDTSKDRSDADVVRDNHRFLWSQEDDSGLTWEQRLAKRYWEKLYHEYCICDLSRYKENKVAMRFQTEAEVRSGKGQFACGAKKCRRTDSLRTWEVNFAYDEAGEKKNALVKLRLCSDCSFKLNYRHKKKEVKRKTTTKKKKKRKKRLSSSSSEESDGDKASAAAATKEAKTGSEIWKQPVHREQEKSREDDFDEYLTDMIL